MTSEADGQPATAADSDDTTGTPDDEDGVTLSALTASTVNTTTASVTVDLHHAGPSSNRLDAWIDFNQDGDWDDVGEQIFTSYDLGTTNGAQSLTFTVPQDTGGSIVYGTTYARFRLSTAGGLLPTGPAVNGEVEDYQLTILSHVVGRHVFYNRSAWDGNNAAANAADDNAIASDKVALLPGRDGDVRQLHELRPGHQRPDDRRAAPAGHADGGRFSLPRGQQRHSVWHRPEQPSR